MRGGGWRGTRRAGPEISAGLCYTSKSKISVEKGRTPYLPFGFTMTPLILKQSNSNLILEAIDDSLRREVIFATCVLFSTQIRTIYFIFRDMCSGQQQRLQRK